MTETETGTTIDMSVMDAILDALEMHPDIIAYRKDAQCDMLDADHPDYDEAFEKVFYDGLNEIHRKILTPMFFQRL